MKTILTTLVLMIFSFQLCLSQKVSIQRNIYFDSDKSELKDESKTILNNLTDSLKSFKSYKIYLKGHTDDEGDSLYNQTLAKDRVMSTLDYLCSKGIAKNEISSLYFGENKPIANNETEVGKQKNRRVEIQIVYELFPIEGPKQPISDLYRQMETFYQGFSIDPNVDNSLRCQNGTIVHIPANSFSTNSKIQIQIKEMYNKSDMIINNLSTLSDNNLLQSGGMLHIQAVDSKGKSIDLAQNKNITILMPSLDVQTDMQLFLGDRNSTSNINWQLNGTSYMNYFFMRDFFDCSIKNYQMRVVQKADKCPFFFCGLSQIFQKSYWNKPKNKSRISWESYSYETCYYTDSLLEAYGVSNLNQLYEAIYKEQFKKYNVKTINALMDTLSKIKLVNIETSYANNKVKMSDLQYYIYNTSKLGWINCDRFTNYAPELLTDYEINLKPDINVDCKLVFKSESSLMSPVISENKYSFKNVPKDSKVWIVAIKYVDNKPLLAIQDAEIGKENPELEFRELSIAELKSELKRLNI